MEIHVKIYLITYFIFLFWFSIMILSYRGRTLICPMSQLQTEQLMTSHGIFNTHL